MQLNWLFFQKQYLIFHTNQEDYEVLDVNYKLRASKLAVGKNKESNGWYVSETESQSIDDKFSKKEYS